MGVISFGDDRPVFGSSASFIRGFIGEAIDVFGEKEYLLHCRYLMEWGYNAVFMEELHVDEIRELASAIAHYRDSYLARPGLEEATRESVEQLTDELATAMKIYVAQRVAAGQFTVERDFWTLRSAEDALQRAAEPLPDISDPNAFVMQLAKQVNDGLLSPDAHRSTSIETRLAQLGAYIGEFADELANAEAVFRMIEDGLDGENRDFSEVIMRHLVPAMVEAGDAAGMWETLQRYFGTETRNWAMEHHSFELEPPENLQFFPSELQRLRSLIEAAKAGDWTRFRRLSDQPFVNDDAMRQTFDMSVPLIQAMGQCEVIDGGVSAGGGHRMVFVKIGDPQGTERIQVVINNVGGRDGGPFHVWNFHPTLDWS